MMRKNKHMTKTFSSLGLCLATASFANGAKLRTGKYFGKELQKTECSIDITGAESNFKATTSFSDSTFDIERSPFEEMVFQGRLPDSEEYLTVYVEDNGRVGYVIYANNSEKRSCNTD